MKVNVYPSVPRGTVDAPPSKSMAHRLLIGAALSDEPCEVCGVSDSEDIKATLSCLENLSRDFTVTGAKVEFGNGKRKNSAENPPVFDCRESGSTLRFFIPISLVLSGGGVFTGAKRLIERGVEVYQETLASDGVLIRSEEDRVVVEGRLKGGKYTVRGGVSSQYISGLLFALPLLEVDSEIVITEPFESRLYVDMTIGALNEYGVIVKKLSDNRLFVPGNQHYRGGRHVVEGDWSNGAFLLALKTLSDAVVVRGLSDDSLQGDKACRRIFEKIKTESPIIDLADCPDLAPISFVMASLHGGARFVNTRRLRIKESDRAAVMAEELKKLGVETEVYDNEVVVHGGVIRNSRLPLNGHNDHRVVMALCVLLTVVGGSIEGAEAVAKSYPDFFVALKALGVRYDFE